MKKLIALSITASIFLLQNIHAQETQELKAITVTAQKTEQIIQDVPMSLSVFDEYLIEDAKIESVKDIAPYTPNFMVFDYGSGMVRPVVRGLSSNVTTLSTSAGMFIDGIPVLHGVGYDEALMDIERIEVLKGPQGTLYGKDTLSGAINIITKQPDNEARGKVTLEAGEDNKREFSLSTSGPVVQNKFYVGISAKHYEKDGLVKNTFLDNRVDDKAYNYGKLILRTTPTDNLDISLISSIMDRDNGGPANNDLSVLQKDKEVYSDLESKNTSSSRMHALRIKYDFGNYQLQSITTKRDVEDTTETDQDYTNIYEKTYHMFKNNEYGNISQELRLSSSTDRLNWLVGVYADKDDNTMDYHYDKYMSARGMMFNGHDIYDVDGKSLGVFTHGDYGLTDKLNIIAGIRYDKDKKYFKERLDSFDPAGTDLADESNSYSEISPKFGLNYKLNNTSSVYTTISKGYKSGGYYAFAPTDKQKQYEKETLISYEIGTKNSFLDNRLILNSAVYYMDVDDMQVVSYTDSYLSYMSNAAKATSKGIELDLNYALNDKISLHAAYGLNITKFDEFIDSKGDYSDNYNPYAPKYNYNIGMSYRDASGYFGRVDLNGYGKTYFNKENTISRDAYQIVNAKIGYETSDFDIYLYANNLFDEAYNGFTTATKFRYSEPREIGIQLAYRF